MDYARSKLQKKGLDMIIANDVANQRIGFNSDNNAVTVLTHTVQKNIPECSKQVLARELIELISTNLND